VARKGGLVRCESRVDMTPAEELRKGGIRKALRIGINRAASPVKASVVAHAAAVKKYGFLAKSIRIRVRTYAADRWASVIGPSTRYARKKGKFTRGKKKGQPRLFKPSKYAHLVEDGTKRSKAKPWLRPAFNESAGGFLRRAGQEIGRELELELQRQRAKKAGAK
jgi:hypothetical protein